MVEYRGVERFYPKLAVYLKLLSSKKKLNQIFDIFPMSKRDNQLFDIFSMSKRDKKDFQSDSMEITNIKKLLTHKKTTKNKCLWWSIKNKRIFSIHTAPNLSLKYYPVFHQLFDIFSMSKLDMEDFQSDIKV